MLDPFCGSGTTLAVAERLGRRWIGIDSGEEAVKTTRRRLRGKCPCGFEGCTDSSPLVAGRHLSAMELAGINVDDRLASVEEGVDTVDSLLIRVEKTADHILDSVD